MDADGYPDENELKTVVEWKPSQGWESLLDYVQERWRYGEEAWDIEPLPDDHRRSWGRAGKLYSVSTYGWSGNEDLIRAMKENFAFWHECWESTRSGGHYEFVVVTPTSADS